MLLKRLYTKPDGWVKEVNAKGDCTNPPPVRGVRVLEIGDARHHFSPDLIAKGWAQGWLSRDKGQIVIEAENVTLTYEVRRRPGYYCCHDGAPMDDGSSARAYLEEKFKGVPSPDRNNPSGYEKINYYEAHLVKAVDKAPNAARGA
jgi:hypothetical protein